MTSSLLAIARDTGYLTPVFLPRMETAAFGKIKELLFSATVRNGNSVQSFHQLEMPDQIKSPDAKRRASDALL